jgi:8-oxo-dGTP pyrophosphatase MutT (NUDIX family)
VDVRARLADAPAGRPAVPRHVDSRAAAVLVLLFDDDGEDDEARLVLTRRPDSMPTHRGEVAFPGGRHDPDVDQDLLATALREANEEVGLDPGSVEVLAQLDGLATVGSRFTITPFVGVTDGRPSLTPHPHEVVRVFDVALSDLLHPDAYRSEDWGARPGFEEPFLVNIFEIPGETVWGATARILVNLLAQLTDTR